MSQRCFLDPVYTELFSHAALVRPLVQGYVDSSIVEELKLSTLRLYPGHFMPVGHQDWLSDIVWQVNLKTGTPCFVEILLCLQDCMDPVLTELHVLTHTYSLLQHHIEAENLGEDDKLPFLLPLVLYEGTEPWRQHTSLRDLMPPFAQKYCPTQKYFVIDVPQLTEEQLAQNPSLASAFFRLERAREPEEIRQLTAWVAPLLQEEHCQTLRRPFAEWLDGVVCARAHCQGQIPAVQELLEPDPLLEQKGPTE